MTATILILPLAAVTRTDRCRTSRGAPCDRCGGLRFVAFARMSEAQRRWAPAEAVLPCPDCGGGAQVVPLVPA